MGWKNKIQGKTALVTGAAGGIGLEFAKELALNGASLILLDIDLNRLNEARDSIIKSSSSASSKISPIKKEDINLLALDLTKENLIDQIDKFCEERALDPHILINNAGIFSFNPVSDTSSKKINLFIDLHVRAVTQLSRWFAIRRKEKGSGWMLNMSSMSCWMPMPGIAMYSSTKSYIRVFTRALHYELKDYGVSATVACPGGIATDLFGLPEKWKKFAVAIGVLQTPRTFVKKAIRKMMKKKKQYINGGLNRFSIFFVSIMPTSVRMQVKRRLLDRGITR